MAHCECLPACPFFHDRMENMPVMADMYKRNYCQGDNSKCARYAVFTALGKGRVPRDLIPNDHDRVHKILSEAADR